MKNIYNYIISDKVQRELHKAWKVLVYCAFVQATVVMFLMSKETDNMLFDGVTVLFGYFSLSMIVEISKKVHDEIH